MKRETKLVKLIVGPEKVGFRFNRALLCFHSEFFDRGFFSGFRETESQEMQFPEDDPKCIEAFGAWVQTGVISLDIIYGGKPGDRGLIDDDGKQIWDVMILSRLWVLGNKLLCKAFCNTVMWMLLDSLVEKGREVIDYKEATYIFENTVPESKLRRLVMDFIRSDSPFTRKRPSSYFQDWFEGLAKGGEVIQALVIEGGLYNKDRDRHPAKWKNRHLYYEVEDEEKKGSVEWRKDEF